MKRTFVRTENAMKFLAGVTALEKRGAGEACLMVVDGEPGLGKSTMAQWWAVQHGAKFLRAKQRWTPPWVLRELLAEFPGVQPEHSFERMFRQAIEQLGNAAAEAEREGRPFAVVIDEVDHISGSRTILETLRDLSDMLEVPFILVGMGRVRHNLTRFPQVASRVGQVVQFERSSLDDVRALIEGLCDVPVAADLVEYVHRVSEGRFREVKEAIAAIERVGGRNKGAVMDVAAMAGEVLLNCRRSGKPIVARAA